MQPVYAVDVGRAVGQSAINPLTHGGQTYEIGGPQVLTMGELNKWICQAIGRSGKPIAEIPDAIGRMMARTTGWLPGAPISWDQWLMLERDSVVTGGGTGFEPFDMRPTPLAAVAETWLTSYRRAGRFADSPY
jgi:NADH dehydrogenase